MRKAVLYLALLAIIVAGCGGRTLLPTGFTVPTLAPIAEPSPYPTATLPPALTSTPGIAAVPVLEVPTTGTLMDNGRSDGLDRMVWFFDWSDVPGAQEYELLVIRSGAMMPVIQEKVTQSSYYNDNIGLGTMSLDDWTWKVRARIGTVWGPWSKLGVFDLETMNLDSPLLEGGICEWAELLVDRSSPVQPLSIAKPDGLTIHEYLLEKHSPIGWNSFEPVGFTQEEVLALKDAHWGEPLQPSAYYDTQPDQYLGDIIYYPKQFRGADLIATEYEEDSVDGIRRSGRVTLGESVVFEVPPEPLGVYYIFRALEATETDWFVEVAHHVSINYGMNNSLCLLGDVVQNGESLSTRYGYREAFGFQLLDEKPFYFFNQDGQIGFSYDGKASWLGFDEIPKYQDEYGTVGPRTPMHWENAVAFFGRRGDNWYFVEIVKNP